ncbi:hypothetical protein WS70_16370 [Burkholderia mayonis]|uniref:Major facilitator superfamily (MFS) profile domain-containing protein n=1 Tax=Burkholderia mayonis TaxID=1385591 RepID=A0A1B4FHN8_9BURK|nr:hypothetical protein WS70_16370 [Burkholderia mayonis]KVE45386.1 hypothetical protein WS70_04680 [Burkholderia mayonis]
MRPIGSIVLGLYADRAGRKAALSLVILLMTLGIFLIAVAPPYAPISIDRGCSLRPACAVDAQRVGANARQKRSRNP